MTSKKKRDWKSAFVEALRKTGNVKLSCEMAGISRKVAYETKGRDRDFGEEWLDALDEATDTLEAEARRRAIEGTERTVVKRIGVDENGKPKYQEYVEREYSDTLLIFLLKANRPSKFRDSFDIKSIVDQIADAQTRQGSPVGHRQGTDGGE